VTVNFHQAIGAHPSGTNSSRGEVRVGKSCCEFLRRPARWEETLLGKCGLREAPEDRLLVEWSDGDLPVSRGMFLGEFRQIRNVGDEYVELVDGVGCVM
jgi:hypothetical protein